MQQQLVVSLPINVTTYDDAAHVIGRWASLGERRSVCAANVHVVMEAQDHPEYREAVQNADLITSDGMPLVWALRLLGWKEATRVYGPDLMLRLLDEAERAGIPIGVYGSAPGTLDQLVCGIVDRFPALQIVFQEAPPFRPLTADEDRATVERMRRSGARLMFIGLGCPKQEYWMADHKDRIPAVLVGVGAAFDFIAGTKKQAPAWLQAAGLEWAFRLATEPRRLWRRYARHNPRFVAFLLAQMLGSGDRGSQEKK
jgi:N-acetylglucosaminyldiphosphoundecaprenol N-acetyl-beta-D-mannosaminyltransferase